MDAHRGSRLTIGTIDCAQKESARDSQLHVTGATGFGTNRGS